MPNALLPEWPARTVALLATAAEGPHVIPVSAPVRAGDRRILLSLRRDRGSVARIRHRPAVALAILAAGDVAFTARGRASIAADPMPGDPNYVAVSIDVEHVDDHRQPAFRVTAGVDREWVDDGERSALGARVRALGG